MTAESEQRTAPQKIAWSGEVLGVQPRIDLGRSFDQRQHSYLGYVLFLRGEAGGEAREFSVRIGPGAQAKHAGHSPEHWRRLARDGVDEGARNASLASLAGHLLWHEVDPEVAMELLLAWNRTRCRPPLEDAEVARVVESIARLHRAE